MAAPDDKTPVTRPGIAVDSRGGSVVDPTENVKALSEAATRRQDDLRNAADALNKLGHKKFDKIIELEVSHLRALLKAETKRLNEQMALRAAYSERLEKAEASRIDAIRAVDVNAVAVASQRASDQATVLANQVAQSAEALRTLVATTAATVANSQAQLATTLSTRLTTLEQASYQSAGKQSFADPALIALVEQVKALSARGNASEGKSEGVGQSWGVFMGIAGLAVAVIVGAVSLIGRGNVQPATPLIQYVPVPQVAPVAPLAPAPAR